MKTEYDHAKLKSRKNPYASKLKKSVMMRLPGQQSKSTNQLAAGCMKLDNPTAPAQWLALAAEDLATPKLRFLVPQYEEAAKDCRCAGQCSNCRSNNRRALLR